MARVVSPIGISSPLVLADFYREEFLRHRECLAQQREYYSERAITDADCAITRVLNQLEHLCAKEDADKVMTRRTITERSLRSPRHSRRRAPRR